MSVSEEVVVNLKIVNKGFDQSIKVMDEVGKTARNVDKATKSAMQTFKDMGKALGTVTLAFRAFNLWTKKSTGALAVLRKGTKAWTDQADKMIGAAAKFAGKVAPKMLGVLTALAPAIIAVAVAMKLWTESLTISEKGADRAAIATSALDIAYKGLVGAVSVASDAVTSAGIAMAEYAEKTGIAARMTGIVVRLLLAQAEAARAAEKAVAALNLAQVQGAADLKQDLAIINTQLRNQNISEEERIKLLGDRALAEKAIFDSQIPLLESKKEQLEIEAKTEVGYKRQQEILLEIAKIDNEIATANNNGANSLAKAGVLINNILTAEKGITEEKAKQKSIAPPLDPFSDPTSDDETSQFVMKGKELSDIYSDIAAEFEQDMIDGFEAVEEAGEEHMEVMSKRAEAQARTRLAWAELETSGQLGLFAGLAGDMADLFQDNFAVQKAFKMGEAVMNTAAALAAIWAPPTTASAPFLTPFIVANGAAQIAAIASAQPGQTGSAVNPVHVRGSSSMLWRPTESASAAFNQQALYDPANNAPVPILVTEDLTSVQARVAVTEARATI